MKYLKAFLLLTRGKQIALVVCAVHLLTICSLVGHHLISSRLRPPRPMVVRTIATAEKKVEIKQEKAAPQAKKTTTPAPKPTPKPVPPKPAAKPASTPKPAPTPEKRGAVPKLKNPPKIEKEITESFQAFEPEPQKPSRATLNIPSAIHRKTEMIQEEELNVDPTYSEFLIAYLQTALDLPEFGEVKAKIEIDRFGRLIHLEILDAKSAKNAQFLKAELPGLNFPTAVSDANQIFTITFRNL